MVGIDATQLVYVYRHHGVVDQAMEKLAEQVHIKTANHGAGEFHVVSQTWATRQIQHHAAQGFVQRHLAVAIAAYAHFVAYGLLQGLAQGDADVFNGVVVINVQIAFASDVHVYHAVAADLIEHVFQERDAGIKTTDAFTIQIDADTDLGF